MNSHEKIKEATRLLQEAHQEAVDFLKTERSRRRGEAMRQVHTISNMVSPTPLFFEVFRNWTGIVVEPSPTQIELTKAARRSPCLGYAVAGKSGKADFMEVTAGYTQMSGFLDSYDAELLTKVRANPAHKEVVHKLSKKTLQSILNEHKLKKIDYLSLDVEGGEMDILTNFPFEKYDIDLFSIENNTQSSEIPQLMKSKGYELVEFVGVDDIYRKAKT